MNLRRGVFVKVIATTQAQCVNTPDFLGLWAGSSVSSALFDKKIRRRFR